MWGNWNPRTLQVEMKTLQVLWKRLALFPKHKHKVICDPGILLLCKTLTKMKRCIHTKLYTQMSIISQILRITQMLVN